MKYIKYSGRQGFRINAGINYSKEEVGRNFFHAKTCSVRTYCSFSMKIITSINYPFERVGMNFIFGRKENMFRLLDGMYQLDTKGR